MTAIIEAIVWLCAGTAAGLAIGAWFWQRIGDSYDTTIDELLAVNYRLHDRIAALERLRERDGEEWKDL